jgi:hypothetical protein
VAVATGRSTLPREIAEDHAREFTAHDLFDKAGQPWQNIQQLLEVADRSRGQ